MLRKNSLIKSLCISALISYPVVACASVLDRVLELASALYPQIRAANFTANIAENAGSFITEQRTLSRGDHVIIGYDGSGAPVLAFADSSGVLVTTAQADKLVSGGVSAGLYPVGSALYSVPPAGQLSIFNQSTSGDLLSQARTAYMTRVDGSISNIISTLYPPEISQIAALESGMRSFDFGNMGTTALGAVNAGEIVTDVQVITGIDAIGLSGIDLARLSRGPNVAFDYGLVDTALALSSRVEQMGGSVNASTLAVNLATNGTEVTGRVENVILGVNGSIVDVIATTIGAVNGGHISN
jgi:hypothetical protein